MERPLQPVPRIVTVCVCLTLCATGALLEVGALQDAAESTPTPVYVVSDVRISESSGLAASRTNTGCLWVHNDSGDSPRLFLIGDDGRTIETLTIDRVNAVDWEDMCSFEVNAVPWLLIADVGDNQRSRNRANKPCRLYLIREPESVPGRQSATVPADITIQVAWPDGPIDCESVAVDTQTREIMLLEKSNPFQCRMYRIPLDLERPKQQHVAQLANTIAVPYATAIDVSPDGSKLAVATMWGGMLFHKVPGETWESATSRQPVPLLLPKRRQGETICFSTNGSTLFVNSEGVSQPVYRVNVPSVRGDKQ